MDITNEMLQKQLDSKTEEIEELKSYMFKVLDEIRFVATSNNYAHVDVQKRKISELCTEASYKLLCKEK